MNIGAGKNVEEFSGQQEGEDGNTCKPSDSEDSIRPRAAPLVGRSSESWGFLASFSFSSPSTTTTTTTNNSNNSNLLLMLLVNTKNRKEIKISILAKRRAQPLRISKC